MSALALLFWYDDLLTQLKRPKEAAVSEAEAEPISNPRIERLGGFSTVRAGAGDDRWSGAEYALGLSRRTVGSRTLSLNVAHLPPGGSIDAHIHDGYEVGLYVLQGRLEHRFGPGLSQSLINGPGDFIFVESGVPHAAFNLSDDEPVVVVVARTTPDEWADVVPYDPEK
jgi:uncharacterized RmlC-like cupin family protein